MLIAGVDPSTKTGLVVLNFDSLDDYEVVCVEEISEPRDRGMSRAVSIAVRTVQALTKHQDTMDVFIEGYSYAQRVTQITAIEVAAIIRAHLYSAGFVYKEVAPTSLKKFVTGVGKGKKDVIMRDVYKRWAFENSSDNIVDAFALAMFGAAYHGLVTVPANHMAAVDSFRQKEAGDGT